MERRKFEMVAVLGGDVGDGGSRGGKYWQGLDTNGITGITDGKVWKDVGRDASCKIGSIK